MATVIMSATGPVECTPIVTRDGRLVWRAVIVGPRGGRQIWYAPRIDGQAAPSGREIWSDRLRRVSGADYMGSPSGLRSAEV